MDAATPVPHAYHSVFSTAIAPWRAPQMNLSLLLFNLLVPAYPMDGGRLLVDALLWRGVSAGTTAKVAICLSAPIGVGLIVWGAVQFQLVTILVRARCCMHRACECLPRGTSLPHASLPGSYHAAWHVILTFML